MIQKWLSILRIESCQNLYIYTSVMCSIPSTYFSRVVSQIPSLTDEAKALANAYFSNTLFEGSSPRYTVPRISRVFLQRKCFPHIYFNVFLFVLKFEMPLFYSIFYFHSPLLYVSIAHILTFLFDVLLWVTFILVFFQKSTSKTPIKLSTTKLTQSRNVSHTIYMKLTWEH